MNHLCLSLSIVLLATVFPAGAAEPDPLAEGVLFRASFDRSADADSAKGDARIYTAESLARKKPKAGMHTDAVQWQPTGGRKGGALRFRKRTKQLVYFKAERNVAFRKSQFSGTISLWMKLDPKRDLPKGFVDPLQITDEKWNDASFFVDFDQGKERDFRLGVFSDIGFWNPNNRKFDDIPLAERPMVTVKNAPFSRDTWTHVGFTWRRFNSDGPAEATLFLQGEAQGTIEGKQRFTWDPSKAVIMLGINYVGLMDELVIYDRALSESEVQQLSR